MQFIHENYRKNLSLDEIASQAMLSKSSALNLFRNYLHITPVNYLINYRLKQAALLLSHTEKKVSTISAETGFHNIDYFCKAFKKHYQVTPGNIGKKSGINSCCSNRLSMMVTFLALDHFVFAVFLIENIGPLTNALQNGDNGFSLLSQGVFHFRGNFVVRFPVNDSVFDQVF